MTEPPTLLAVTSGGDRWEDPSEDLLYMLLEDLVDEHGGSFRISRLDNQDEHALDVSLVDGVFRVGRYEGPDAVPLVATTVELREVHAACTRWAFRLDDDAARAEWGGFDGTLPWQAEPGTTR